MKNQSATNCVCSMLSVLASATMLLGCGSGLATDYRDLGLVPVSGTVTLDGQPVEGAVVFFESPDLTQSYATTDREGNYQMKFNSEQMGVTPGEKIVRISTTASTGEVEEIEEEDEEDFDPRKKKKPTGPADRIPATYNTESKITVNVSSENATFNFSLNGRGTVPVN